MLHLSPRGATIQTSVWKIQETTSRLARAAGAGALRAIEIVVRQAYELVGRATRRPAGVAEAGLNTVEPLEDARDEPAAACGRGREPARREQHRELVATQAE